MLNRSTAATDLRDGPCPWLAAPEDEPPGNGEPLAEAVALLTRQLCAWRMDYTAARRAGQPVGSRPVKANCKYVFNVRRKRSGARKKERLAGHVVDLRTTALSNPWDLALAMPEIGRAHV